METAMRSAPQNSASSNAGNFFTHVMERLSLDGLDACPASELAHGAEGTSSTKSVYGLTDLEDINLNLHAFKQILNLMDPAGNLRQSPDNDSFAAELDDSCDNVAVPSFGIQTTAESALPRMPLRNAAGSAPRSNWIIRPLVQQNTRQEGPAQIRGISVTAAPSSIVLQRITNQNPSVSSSRDNFAVRESRRAGTSLGGPQARQQARRQFSAYANTGESAVSGQEGSSLQSYADDDKDDEMGRSPLTALLAENSLVPNSMNAATRRRYNIMLRLAYQSQMVRQRQQSALVTLRLSRPLTCPLTLISCLQASFLEQNSEQSFASSFLTAGSAFSGSQGISGFKSRASGCTVLEDMWQVNVSIESCDWNSGTISGTMQAIDVPSLANGPASLEEQGTASSFFEAIEPLESASGGSSPNLSASSTSTLSQGPLCSSARCVTTFWDGEIIDFNNFELWTRKWSAKPEDDKEHWRQFEPIKIIRRVLKDKRKCVIERALFLAKYIQTLRRDYIFMRWKERFFLENATANSSGLTIAGFYYICLRRSDGACQGFYYDTHSSPYQQLFLKPSFPCVKMRPRAASNLNSNGAVSGSYSQDYKITTPVISDPFEEKVPICPSMAFSSYQFA